MDEGLARAKQLAEDAPWAYARLKAIAEPAVVRWEWATFATHSFEPAYFEINKFNRGQALPSEPAKPMDGAYGYGFDSQGRVVVERIHTEFPGRVDETFFIHEREGIASYRYSYKPDKAWMNVQWFVAGAHGIIEVHSVSAQGNWSSKTYQYDERARVVGCQRRGNNSPTELSMTPGRSNTTARGK